jgi:hypothetical protein
MKHTSIFGERIIMPKGRICHPQLFEPGTKYNEGKYSCTIIYDKDDVESLNGLKLLKKECLKVAAAAFPDKEIKDIPLPFRTDNDEEREEYEGKVRITAKSAHRPDVVGPNPKEKLGPADIYGGCYVRVSVTPHSWVYLGKFGVSLYLGNVQKVADGERFGKGGVPASAEFDVVEYETSGADDICNDDIPF